MRIRRCAIVQFEPRETLRFDLAGLLDGGDGLSEKLGWVALAPHLARALALTDASVQLLGAISPTRWQQADALEKRHGVKQIRALLRRGLLIGSSRELAELRRRDQVVRDGFWQPQAAVAHRVNRWQGVSGNEAAERAGLGTMAQLIETLGAPPPAVRARGPKRLRLRLPRAAPSTLSELLERRLTCRNFDASRPLALADFAQVLERALAARATLELAPGHQVLKKSSPSGGGMHPTEAYLLVRRVAGLAAGLYHYHPIEHALEPLPWPGAPASSRKAPSPAALDRFALRALAGQHYLANAAVLVMLAPRFARSFWKYREHAKAYRVAVLDVGHLSQTIYLSATELGLGVFVSAAINEVEIERTLGLEPMLESPIAICGFGPRGAGRRRNFEFDPTARDGIGVEPVRR